jgi:hypothetical protein
VRQLLVNAGRPHQRYEEIVRRLFIEMRATEPGESVVLRTYRSMLRERDGRRVSPRRRTGLRQVR